MQIFYTVRAGDTLYSIAARWFIPINSLIAANNMTAPYIIYPGQQLSMPPGVTSYIVKPGDSVYSISLKYGLPMNRIIEANGLEEPYIINPGMQLVIPEGMPYYTVRQGDTLWGIASRYNVTVNGQPRPDIILKANYGLTPAIYPGMRIIVPYAPPGGAGKLAAVMTDEIATFLQLLDPVTGDINAIKVDTGDIGSRVFWSPDGRKAAYIGVSGVITVVDVDSGVKTKIDQISQPFFVSWTQDSRKLAYSTGSVIRIYDLAGNAALDISIARASYVQWFPSDKQLLYEANDQGGISQLFRINADGGDNRQITRNSGSTYNYVRLSPNGRYVLYTTPGASASIIYTIDLATGQVTEIPGSPEGKNYYPAFSPDSSRIAYSAVQFINGKFYSFIRVSGVKGEGDTTLAISSCYSAPVAWSPDGTRLAYLSGCREDAPPVGVWSIDLSKPAPVNALSGFLYYDIDW